MILFELFGLRGVYSFAPDSGTTIGPDGTVQFRTNPAFERWLRVEDMAFKAVSFLNLPGGLVQLAPAIFRADHDEWIPEHVETRIWNAVTWPISALPFWWIIGRGVEALHAARKRVIAPRLRWFESMISFLLLAGGATLAVGFLFFAGEDPGDWMTVVACGLWALLGGMSVLARYLQWRIKKELQRTKSSFSNQSMDAV